MSNEFLKPPPPRKLFEYAWEPDFHADDLFKYGREGWELVTIDYERAIAYFKRELRLDL